MRYALLLCALACANSGKEPARLLNVSYDPTRELYAEVNAAFARYWKAKTGQDVEVDQSHGGSAKQARGVIDGLPADVVTLGAGADIDAIADKSGLLPKNWQTRLPENSAPYTSTIIFVVRQGNPKSIRDWEDLARPDVSVIPGNPKTSAAARWAYLAAYGWALERHGSEAAARGFLSKLYGNAPVLDSGARASTTTFAERDMGDVLLNWENDAILLTRQNRHVTLVYPSVSILAEPCVAWIDKNAEQHHVLDVAQAYLEYLYSNEGQEIAARHYFRPHAPAVSEKFASGFPPIRRFAVGSLFGSWDQTMRRHFSDGGVFDQIYALKK